MVDNQPSCFPLLSQINQPEPHWAWFPIMEGLVENIKQLTN
ncbi:hypothetical protein L581_0582 [Serratia fonticola AU-AP2C]|nr:hypothetical protein L581_0582 [Serratia fonticola AU-AP2C]